MTAKQNPRAMDEKGADSGPTGLLGLHDKAQRYCNLCPRLCHHSCPVSNAERDETVTPGHKNALAGRVARAIRPLDEEAADIFYKCVNCGLCTTVCQHENDVSESLLSARAVAVRAGLEAPALAELRRSFHSFGNAWLEDLRPRLRDLVPKDLRVGDGAANHAGLGGRERGAGRSRRKLRVYWPGCAAVARRPDLVSLTLEVLGRLGEGDVKVYCGDEAQCCGYPLLAAGQHDAFVDQARKASRALSGADVIFTASPECAWTFAVAWPRRAGLEPPARHVGHVVDLLLPAVERAPMQSPLDLDVVYHDPCYLGRFLGRFDEPRSILKRLLQRPPVEAGSWIRDEGYCCGAGGGLEITSPDTSLSIARARAGHLLGVTTGPPGEPASQAELARASKNRHIATACTRCSIQFGEVGASAVDIVELLARYLGIEGAANHPRLEDERGGGL